MNLVRDTHTGNGSRTPNVLKWKRQLNWRSPMRIDRSFRDYVMTFKFPHQPGTVRRIVIGRPREGMAAPDIDLTPDFTASRPHAAIAVEADGRLYVEDLHSTH